MNIKGKGIVSGDSSKKSSKPKRARDEEGRFVADDESTPDYNEAWVDGVAPKKTKKYKRSKKYKSK